jgi:hypothetical protein
MFARAVRANNESWLNILLPISSSIRPCSINIRRAVERVESVEICAGTSIAARLERQFDEPCNGIASSVNTRPPDALQAGCDSQSISTASPMAASGNHQ